MEGHHSGQPGLGRRCKTLYVGILLRSLPMLINAARHASTKVQRELDYLGSGYAFQLKVRRSTLECVCRINDRGNMERVASSLRATDVEFGSGLPSSDPSAITIDYAIAFRSLDYAFACFSGSMSLKEALAERAFTTRGPNDTGVALTYMFASLLKMFFFWRRPYRSKKASSSGLSTPHGL